MTQQIIIQVKVAERTRIVIDDEILLRKIGQEVEKVLFSASEGTAPQVIKVHRTVDAEQMDLTLLAPDHLKA